MVKNIAYVIVITSGRTIRYYDKFGPTGRLVSAWSLAGARLFGTKELTEQIQSKLREKGYTVCSMFVTTNHTVPLLEELSSDAYQAKLKNKSFMLN